MYFTLHRLKIPPANYRRSGFALVATIVCFATYLFASFFGIRSLGYYALQASLLATLFTIVFAVPYIAAAIAVFLAPPAVYIIWDSPSLPLVRQWWFWPFVVAAVVFGIWVLSIAVKKYPKRDS